MRAAMNSQNGARRRALAAPALGAALALILASGPAPARPCAGGDGREGALPLLQIQGQLPGRGGAEAAESAPLAAEIAHLMALLRLDEELPILREEGLDYADSIARSLFPERSEGAWQRIASGIYAPDRMKAMLLPPLSAELVRGGADRLTEITAFFSSPLGRRITSLELSARAALLDDEIEKANADRVKALRARGDPRIALLRRFIEANDLIGNNLRSTMESDFAFYVGLREGGGYESPPSDAEILDQIRTTKDEVRRNVEDWLYEFLWLAYSPLSDEDLKRYIVFSETEAGQTFNRALFAGFDEMFNRISHALGKAAAKIMKSKDL